MRLSANVWRRFFLAAPFFLVVLFTAASCGSGGGGGTSYEKTMTQMTSFIEEQMEKDQVTGLGIALVDEDRTVWARGFGYADEAQQIPATKDTLFEIGSNSKTMVAALVMQLVEAGRLHLNDPLEKHIPNFAMKKPLGSFPSPGGGVTIRYMLNHHSGLPGDLFNGAFAVGKSDPKFNDYLVAYLAGEYGDFPPGFLLAYSNTAYSLLADVVAAASGQSFQERSQAFFRDLGMDHTTFFRESAAVPPHQSKGYLMGQEYGPFYCNIPAAGSVLSSASDMAKYLKMVLAGGVGERNRVLSKETLSTMLTRTNGSVALDGDVSVGLGWFLSDDPLTYAGRLCWHNGGTLLMMSHMEILRDHGLGVVVMTNSITGAAVAHDAAHKALQLALEEKKGLRPPKAPDPDPSPVVTWTDAQLDAVAGIYVTTTTGYDRLVREDGGLRWVENAHGAAARDGSGDVLGETGRRLVPRANGWFSSPDSQGEQFEFVEMEGRRVMISHTSTFKGLLAERYEPPADFSDAWKARRGIYDLVNLREDDASRALPPEYGFNSFTAEFDIQDGLLVLELTQGLRKGMRYVIHPLSDTLGYLRGLGRNLGSSVQIISTGAGEELQLLGLRYRKR